MHQFTGQEAKDKIWSLIKDIKFALMASYATSGEIFHARPMMAQQKEFDGTLWFFTAADSRKTAEIKNNPTSLLTYADPSKNNYVSISGKATILRDQAKIDELWSEAARVWFPEGKGDPNLILIRFDPQEAEFWDAPSSAAVHAYGYIKAVLTGETPKSGEMGHAEFRKAGNA